MAHDAGMTVADLIRALQALPPDLPVLMPSHQSPDFVPPLGAILDTMAPSLSGGWELCDYEDEGITTVARLLAVGEVDERAERPKPATH